MSGSGSESMIGSGFRGRKMQKLQAKVAKAEKALKKTEKLLGSGLSMRQALQTLPFQVGSAKIS